MPFYHEVLTNPSLFKRSEIPWKTTEQNHIKSLYIVVILRPCGHSKGRLMLLGLLEFNTVPPTIVAAPLAAQPKQSQTSWPGQLSSVHRRLGPNSVQGLEGYRSW